MVLFGIFIIIFYRTSSEKTSLKKKNSEERIYVTGSAKTCQISPCSKIDFLIYFGRRINLIQDTLSYRPRPFHCEDTAADKQPVSEAIVEKLHSKLDFRWLMQLFVFLRISINVIMSFNNSHTIKCRYGDFPVYVSL